MIKIPKDKCERMLSQIKFLRELEEVYMNLVKQFKNSLKDIKKEDKKVA